WITRNAWAAVPTWTAINTIATDGGTGHGYCGWNVAAHGIEDQCNYDHDILVNPTNPNVLYAGGIPLWKFDGTRWSEISNMVLNPTNAIHVDQHILAWADDRLIVGNDGGLWSTIDDGLHWTDHNTNLSITEFYHGALDPEDPLTALGATQDNGVLRRTE